MVKITGAQLLAFMNDKAAWPGEDGDTWYEDALFAVNGVEVEDYDPEQVPFDSIVSVTGGVVFGPELPNDGVSLETHLRRWIKRQNTVMLLVECSQQKVDEVKAAIKAAGGKIVL